MPGPIHLFKDYLTKRFGHALHRVPVDFGFGCPHGGCSFCAENAGRARQLAPGLDIEAQVRAGTAFAERRYHADGAYIAYFQASTSTNAPAAQLRQSFERALGAAKFQLLIVATRPDCLPPDTLDYLAELNGRLETWVELGVQTANDQTLARINRGHDFACSARAVEALARRGIKTAAHVVLGLPGETAADFRLTAARLAALPFSAVKIHNLLILKSAPLAQDPPRTMDEHEYAWALADFLRRVPAAWPVMRLKADAPPEELLAPKWALCKSRFSHLFFKLLRDNAFQQGDLLGQTDAPHPRPARRWPEILRAPAKVLEAGGTEPHAPPEGVELQRLPGDARTAARELEGQFDAILLDAPPPERRPELWTYDFLRLLTKRLKISGVLLANTAALPVRGALLRLGLHVGALPGGATLAAFDAAKLPSPLPEKERRIILASTSGAPFRDPSLNDTAAGILRRRQALLRRLRHHGVPKRSGFPRPQALY